MTRPRHNVRPELLETAELVPVSTLDFYPGNPRQHADDELAASLVKHGQYKTIGVRRGTRHVLMGNGTFAQILGLGWDHVAVHWIDADDTEAAQIVATDNRLSDLGRDDPGLLYAHLARLDGNLPIGFDDDFVAALAASNAEPLHFDDDDIDDDLAPLPAPMMDVPQPYDTETLIEAGFDYWRRERGAFPLPSTPVHEAMGQINRLARTQSSTLRNTSTAYGVPDAYHPHRFSTPIPGKYTPVAAFDRDDKLRHAIRMLVESGTPVTDNSVRSMLGFVRNAQCAANFRPGFALLLLRMYAPDGGTWLDTSTGFGGRLVAFAASKLSRYVGIDPSTATDAGNRRMVADLGLTERVVLIRKPAEDVQLAEVGGESSCDFAFTSPPYFGKEQYADEPTQSYQRYADGEAWRDGFLLPTLQLQYAALRQGAASVVNIADVKIGGVTYPLTDWTIECAKAAGFAHERTDEFPLSRVPGRGDAPDRFEPVFVFRKH